MYTAAIAAYVQSVLGSFASMSKHLALSKTELQALSTVPF
jgi:hypothetical protein